MAGFEQIGEATNSIHSQPRPFHLQHFAGHPPTSNFPCVCALDFIPGLTPCPRWPPFCCLRLPASCVTGSQHVQAAQRSDTVPQTSAISHTALCVRISRIASSPWISHSRSVLLPDAGRGTGVRTRSRRQLPNLFPVFQGTRFRIARRANNSRQQGAGTASFLPTPPRGRPIPSWLRDPPPRSKPRLIARLLASPRPTEPLPVILQYLD